MKRTATRQNIASYVFASCALAGCVLGGCASGPQRVTKLVGTRLVVTRAVSSIAYEHVARAKLYEEEERWEDAAAELQRALPFDEDAAEVRAELAELFVRVGRIDDASEQAERSITSTPTVAGYLARAHVAEAQGKSAATIDALRSAVATALDDDDPEAIERSHLELGDAQVVALDVPAALETTRRLEHAAHETIRGRVQHAALAWALGDLADAEVSLRAALEREPADIDARILLAELHAASGDAKKAKATFGEALDRADVPLQIAGPVAAWLVERGEGGEAVELADRVTANVADVEGLVLASVLERAAKRPERATDLADRAEKVGAPAGRVAVLRAEALAARDNRDGHTSAVKLLLGVPRDAPEFVESRLRAAEILREDGKLDEAGRTLDRAMEQGGQAGDVGATSLLIARAFVDEKRGDAVRAARRLDEALGRAPDDARLVLARAAVDDRRGEWKHALELAEKVLAREPRSVEALNFAGFVAADHGHDLPRALRRLQAAVALSPGSGGIIDSLGWVYFHAGDLPRATAFLEQANRLEPGDAEILGHLGDLYARKQERDRALDAYRKALSHKPTDKLARELNERLRTLEAKSAAGR